MCNKVTALLEHYEGINFLSTYIAFALLWSRELSTYIHLLY